MHITGATSSSLQQLTPASLQHSSAQLPALQALYDTSEGLETPIQLIYLLSLLGFLAVGAYLVVRQVLIRRELDEGAKALGERIRTGEASCEVCRLHSFVLEGSIMCALFRGACAA